MTDEAKRLRAEAQKRYARAHREEINTYKRKWHKEHPEKNKEYQARYWDRKAQELQKAIAE